MEVRNEKQILIKNVMKDQPKATLQFMNENILKKYQGQLGILI